SNDPSDVDKGVFFGVAASYNTVGIAAGEIAGKILHGADPKTFGVENFVPERLAVNTALAGEFTAWSIPENIRAQAQAKAPDAARAPAPAITHQPQPGRIYKVGLLYFGPHPLFEMTIEGVREALRDAGFIEGRNLVLQLEHPNSDMSLLPQVVRHIADQNLDLLIPLSTTCLGAAIASSKNVQIVFGAVSSPLDVGAGKSFSDHLPHVTGAVWTAPSPALFKWLKQIYPNCKNVGLIYNPSDANSMREKESARFLLDEHGMRLVERTISNPSEIVPTVQSLLGSGVDAVFGMADTTVVSAFPALSQIFRRERIPLLADDNSLMGFGALFSCGASPVSEGRHTGQIAARVLLGENPDTIPFAPSTEAETAVDLEAAVNLGLTLPVAMLKEASVFHHPAARLGRPFRIAMVNLVNNPLLVTAEKGVLSGLRDAGFKEQKDFTVKHFNAQGEISQLPAILDAALTDAPDLVITVTTPALMAAAKRITKIPVVYTVASDPAALGLFTSEKRPLLITGVHEDPPVARLLDMARKYNPDLTAVGIIYDASQPNSLISVEKLRKLCREHGLSLHEATAATVSELPAAAQAVIQRRVGAILLSSDNLVVTGFSTIYSAAKTARVPVYVDAAELVQQGAAGAVGNNYAAWGAQAGRLAAKVLAGVPPGDLPLETARVQEVVEPGSTNAATIASKIPARPWEIRIARYNDAQFSADTWRGIMDGFKQQGLQEKRDFNVRCLNAQGDMTTLASIMTAIRAEQPDLVMTISTPTLQAALRQVGNLPVVFGCVADAVRAGAGKSNADHLPNVTGITTLSPVADMAHLIKKSITNVHSVGTLFSPGEINAEINRQGFAEALEKEGLKLIAIPVNSSAETAEATSALLRSDIQVVCQIMDNTVRPGYAQIAKRSKDVGLPFFCFDSSGILDGAALALGRDYYSSGVEAAEVAVRVLRGANPANIPITNTRTEITAVNSDLIKKLGLVIPSELLKVGQVTTGGKR
ncbi:MAG: ABC transporter substrate binding protein, partial [bacterium]